MILRYEKEYVVLQQRNEEITNWLMGPSKRELSRNFIYEMKFPIHKFKKLSFWTAILP